MASVLNPSGNWGVDEGMGAGPGETLSIWGWAGGGGGQSGVEWEWGAGRPPPSVSRTLALSLSGGGSSPQGARLPLSFWGHFSSRFSSQCSGLACSRLMCSLPFVSCSHPSWILPMSSRPPLHHQPRTPGGAQRPWAPPPRTLGAEALSLQLLILGGVRPLQQPLGILGGLLLLRGPRLTLGVGPRPLQLERGPRLTRGGALTVSAGCLPAAASTSSVQSGAHPGDRGR